MHFISLHFMDIAFLKNKLNICVNPESYQSTGTIFWTIFAYFMPLCHILMNLEISQAFSLLLYWVLCSVRLDVTTLIWVGTHNVVLYPLNCVLLFATPWTPPLSPGVYSNSCPLSWWCCLTIVFSASPFSFCFQSFLASGSVSMSQLFTSVLPMNIHGLFPSGLTGLISL